jgi:hypothetical protein
MISIQGFETGFTIQITNENKPGIFIVRNPELTAQLVTLASTRGRRRRAAEKAPSEVACRCLIML